MKAFVRFLLSLAIASVCLVVIAGSFSYLIKAAESNRTSKKSHIVVLDISGIIINSLPFVRKLEEISKRKEVKALVIQINSPGGLVAPSQEMYEAIIKLDEKIPVIISMQSLAASGGYYAALGGRKIYANSGTLTASIGVIMEFINTEKLYQWAKVERFSLKAGKYKDVGSPLRQMREDEKALMNSLLNDIHNQFRTAVQKRRKLTNLELDSVADGRVLTGSQAKEAKLVDALGTLSDAIKEAKIIANLPDDTFVEYPESKEGMLKELLFGDADSLLWDNIKTLVAKQSLLPSTLGGWKILALSPLE